MIRIPTLAIAHVDIVGKTGKYKAAIADVKRRTNNFGKSATKSIKKITIGLTAMGVAAGIAAVAIGVKLTKSILRAGRASIQSAVKYDKLERGLTAVTGSAAEAQRQLDRLVKVAELPGLSFEQAIQGSINLQAAGLQAELAERALKAFGNALVTVGKGSEDLAGVNLALTQIANKTSGFGQDVRQLQERLPQMQTALKNAFDGKPLEDLEITGKELVEALVVEFEKLEKASGGPANAIENLGIAFDRLKAEVGKTMLGITSSTADSLTGIIDRIRIIIPVWRLYQADLIKIFDEVATVILKSTGEMMKGMIKIAEAAAPLIFKPLVNATKNWLRDFNTGAQLLYGDIGRRLGAISTKQWEDNIINSVNKGQEASNKAAAQFEKDYTAAINNAVNAAVSELPKIGQVGSKALNDILLSLSKVTDEIEKLNQLKSGLKELFKSITDTFGSKEVAINTENFAGNMSALSFIIDKNKAALKAFGSVALIHTENLIKLGIAGKEMAGRIGDSVTENQEKMRDSLESATSGMRSAFSNFIGDALADINSLDDAWSSFVRNFKNAFLRAVADMLADQAFNALLNKLAGIQQGTAGQGGFDLSQSLGSLFGTGVGAFIGNLIAPGIGAVIGAGIGGQLGGSIAAQNQQPSITANFFETSFENMDRNRVQKTFAQNFAPILIEERADGRV